MSVYHIACKSYNAFKDFCTNGTPFQYPCLENPMDGGAWQAAVHGIAKSRTRLSDFTFTFPFTHWRRKWEPTPVFLPGESQGRGSLVGCHLWGRTESYTTETTQQQQQQQYIDNAHFFFFPNIDLFIWLHWDLVGACRVFTLCCSMQEPKLWHANSQLCYMESTSFPIQPYHHPLFSPSPPVLNLSQHQGLFQ